MNKDNLFWGVVFLMAAIYILMRSVGMAPDVSIVRIIIGLLCITGFIKAAIDLEFGGMLFSLAILFIVFRRYIGLESMSSWSILMAALFGTIGLNMLFGDHASAYRNRKRAKRYGEQFERQQEQYEGQMGENTDTSGASQGFYDSNMQGEHIVLSGLYLLWNGSEYDRSEYSFRHSGDHAGYSFCRSEFLYSCRLEYRGSNRLYLWRGERAAGYSANGRTDHYFRRQDHFWRC